MSRFALCGCETQLQVGAGGDGAESGGTLVPPQLSTWGLDCAALHRLDVSRCVVVSVNS